MAKGRRTIGPTDTWFPPPCLLGGERSMPFSPRRGSCLTNGFERGPALGRAPATKILDAQRLEAMPFFFLSSGVPLSARLRKSIICTRTESCLRRLFLLYSVGGTFCLSLECGEI